MGSTYLSTVFQRSLNRPEFFWKHSLSCPWDPSYLLPHVSSCFWDPWRSAPGPQPPVEFKPSSAPLHPKPVF